MADNYSPQLLLMYTTAILLSILPRLTSNLNIAPTPTLLLTTLTATSFFTIAAYLAMDAFFTFTWILLKFLQFLLRFIVPDLSIPNVVGVGRSPGTKAPRSWWEVGVAVMVGVGVMVHIIKYRGGGWLSSLHKIEAKRATQKSIAAGEGGEEEEEESEGRVIVYSSFAFLYTSTLMGCREWFERWWRGGDGNEGMIGKQRQTETEATWELWAFIVALCVAGVVALVQWAWERRARKARVARKEFLDVKEHFGEEGRETITKVSTQS